MNSDANHQEDLGRDLDTLRAWGIRVSVVLLAMLWLMLMASSWADAAESRGDARGENGTGDDEYSFKWLDPEKKIYVLQNRRYVKAEHAIVSVMGGPGLSNPYRNTLNLEGRLGYYFREDLGLEVFYSKGFNSTNNTYRALINTNSGTYPMIRELRGQFGAQLNWVPWYAKINVFNKILYFDWYLSAGAGTINSAVDTNPGGASNYVLSDLFAVFLGTGHQYYVNESLLVRLDLTSGIYQAPLYGTSGEQTWYSNFNFSVGIGLKL